METAQQLRPLRVLASALAGTIFGFIAPAIIAVAAAHLTWVVS